MEIGQDDQMTRSYNPWERETDERLCQWKMPLDLKDRI